MHKYSGEEFLSKLYRDMHTDEQVEKSSELGDSKYEKIRKYLDRLENIHRKLSQKERLSLIKHYYYKKYIIKPENITEEYFEHLSRVAENRGYGFVLLDDFTKEKEKETIINEQRKSLDVWIDYFCSEDSNMYPMWFKYYVFQSVVKLGTFNKEKNVFNQRTKDTIAVFPELNREAIALMYDYFNKILNNKNYILSDKELENLIRGGSFKKIYAYLIKKLSLINKLEIESNQGAWIKYEQWSDHIPLVRSIEGKGTGWCTVGESTARTQLDNGDFYVYYTYDSEGKPTIPRIAIRMEGKNIAEIRGIAESQNLEAEMESILEKKLEEFSDKNKYQKKVNDMNELTRIYKKFKNNEELTKEELTFLYELEDFIDGFGYDRDPRINIILQHRNIREDVSNILNCKEEQVAISLREALYKIEDCMYLKEDIVLNFDNYKGVGKRLPRILAGNLILLKLDTPNGIVLPEIINGDLEIPDLASTDDLKFPRKVNGNVILTSLRKCDNIVLPEQINGELRLTNLNELNNNVTLPKIVNGDINLRKLETIQNLTLPEIIGGSLYLNNLKSAENIIFPEIINGSLFLEKLTTANLLKLPKIINGDLDLSSLIETDNLILPDNINGILNLNSLSDLKGVSLPKKKVVGLSLDSLADAKGLKLPETITWRLNLNSLTSVEGLEIPDTLNCDISLRSLSVNEILKLPKTNCNIIVNKDVYEELMGNGKEELNNVKGIKAF